MIHFLAFCLHTIALSWVAAVALAGLAILFIRFRSLHLVALAAAALFIPTLAHADGLGSVVLGASGGWLGIAVSGALFLASAFHVVDKVVSIVQGLKGDTTIAGHPKATEALDALENAGIHILQDMITPDLLTALTGKLKTDSLSNIGAWLATTYGPKLLADLKAQGQTLLGAELALVLGGDKAVTDAATLRLGVAASKVVATAKTITTLPSGIKLVTPAPQGA